MCAEESKKMRERTEDNKRNDRDWHNRKARWYFVFILTSQANTREEEREWKATITSWVKTVAFRCSPKQKKNIIRPSSSSRRSKITTKATSGGPTERAERLGGVGEGCQPTQLTTESGNETQSSGLRIEKDRYDHAKKKADSWQHYRQRRQPPPESSNEWARKRKRRTNRHGVAGCLVLSRSLSFVRLYGCEVHTYKPNIT